MVFTSTMTWDAIGDPEPIVLPGVDGKNPGYQKITLREQNAGATAGFTIRAPMIGSTAVQYQPGESVELTGQYPAGSTVGYIAAASGSLTMSIVAEGR